MTNFSADILTLNFSDTSFSFSEKGDYLTTWDGIDDSLYVDNNDYHSIYSTANFGELTALFAILL